MKKLHFAIIFLFLLFPSQVFTQISITMTPPRMEFYLDGKKKVQEAFELENKGYQPVYLKIYVTGFSVEENGTLLFSTKQNSAEQWIKVNPAELTIKPHDFAIVRYEVKLPDGTPQGSYTASVMVEELLPPEQSAKKTQFILKGRLAHIVYVNVGKPEYKCQLESFKTEKKEDKLVFSLSLKNEGDFSFRTQGSIDIRSGKEKKITEIALPNVPVLRDSRRIIEVSAPSRDLPAGTYSAALSLDIGAKSPVQALSEFSITGTN